MLKQLVISLHLHICHVNYMHVAKENSTRREFQLLFRVLHICMLFFLNVCVYVYMCIPTRTDQPVRAKMR